MKIERRVGSRALERLPGWLFLCGMSGWRAGFSSLVVLVAVEEDEVELSIMIKGPPWAGERVIKRRFEDKSWIAAWADVFSRWAKRDVRRYDMCVTRITSGIHGASLGSGFEVEGKSSGREGGERLVVIPGELLTDWDGDNASSSSSLS